MKAKTLKLPAYYKSLNAKLQFVFRYGSLIERRGLRFLISRAYSSARGRHKEDEPLKIQKAMSRDRKPLPKRAVSR